MTALAIPKLVWEESLNIGVEKIDAQHQELCSRINASFDSINNGEGIAAVAATFGYLKAYVVLHFGAEERLQLKVGYPDYESHKRDHEEFTRKFIELSESYKKTGATPEFIAAYKRLTTTWLIDHIMRRDQDIAIYVKSWEKENGPIE